MRTHDVAWFAALKLASATFRYVNLDGDEDIPLDLKESLSPAFVSFVSQGFAHFSEDMSQEIRRRIPHVDVTQMSARSMDAAHSLLQRAKLVLCPFTGKWTELTKTIGLEAYWLLGYKDNGCIIGQFCAALHAAGDTTFIFPDNGTVLFFGKMITVGELRERVHRLLAILSEDAENSSRHVNLAAPSEWLGVVEMKTPHFGHYVWNALSAWGHLLPTFSKQAAFFVSWAENRFVGNLSSLFPEIAGKEIITLSEEREMLRLICKRNAFLVFVKDCYITSKLADRVRMLASSACPPGDRTEVLEMRERCELVCLLALRTNNRAWIEQTEGYIALARALQSDHPGIGFVIDGMSNDTTKGWTHALMEIQEEIASSRTICQTISQFAPCINTVGYSLSKSLLAGEMADFFVAPAGSGLAKFKWISNKPGIVISNSIILDWNNPQGWAVRVFEQCRENILKSVYLDPAHVRDVLAPDRPEPLHANFHLDWKQIYLTIINSLPAWSNGQSR